MVPIPTPASTRTVLVVEDYADLSNLYSRVLAAEGYRVVVVPDGIDALLVIESAAPDVIVLDLGLPRLGGRNFAHEIRAHEHSHNIPIVIVTGSDTRELDPAEYPYILRKPITPEELAHAVRQSLEDAPGL
jgi:CheY-like chemotaxis protein